MTDADRAEADAELRALQARLHAAIHRFHDAVHDFNNVSATVKGEVDLAVEQLEALYRRFPELRP
jgi:hypothetical protein